MSYFYEIRTPEKVIVKRKGGFATIDATKTAARENAKRMKNTCQPDRPDIGRMMVGQNTEKPTRY